MEPHTSGNQEGEDLGDRSFSSSGYDTSTTLRGKLENSTKEGIDELGGDKDDGGWG